MLSPGHAFCPPMEYVNAGEDKAALTRPRLLRPQLIKRFIPSPSLNLCRTENLRCLAEQIHKGDGGVLVVGCGNQAGALLEAFSALDCELVFCDIDKNADADVLCDAQALPFEDGSFDAVITTAVLDDLLWPEKGALEIGRVVRESGFVYSELPFLYPVHDRPFDFNRYTLSGHRCLFDRFQEISAGMVAGPGTVLALSIDSFAKCLFKSRRLAQISSMMARLCFSWLKFFDYWMRSHPRAIDGAAGTYFFGRKIDRPTDSREIIKLDGNETHPELTR